MWELEQNLKNVLHVIFVVDAAVRINKVCDVCVEHYFRGFVYLNHTQNNTEREVFLIDKLVKILDFPLKVGRRYGHICDG